MTTEATADECDGPATFEHDTASPRSPGPQSRRLLQGALLGLPVVWILIVGWSHRWMTEDGFIYLRIVDQIGAGNGPVFNAGERVEAYTGTLWVAVLALGDLLLPVRLEWLAIVLGLLFTAAGVALATAGARRLWEKPGSDPLFVPLGSLVFVAVFPTWAYATSGLETGLVFAWLGACLWILAGWARDGDHRLGASSAAIVGLGWLVRPEMVLFSAIFVLVVLLQQWRRDTWAARSRFALAALALPVAYQIFRMGYFGSIVANTAIAKEGSSTNWTRGWRYLLDLTGPYWLWVPLVGLVAGGYLPIISRLRTSGWDRRRWVVGAFPLGALLNSLYVVAVGGDYHHGRMLLPALFAASAPVAAIPATRRHLAGLVVATWALVAVVALRPDQHRAGQELANGFLAPKQFGTVTTDDVGWGDGGPKRAWYSGPAYYYQGGLLQYVRSDEPVRPGLDLPYLALWGVGVSGYSMGTDAHVLDQLGLADTLAAHLEGEPSLLPDAPRYPGHEKPLPAPWVAALVLPDGARPDARDFPSFGNPLIPPTMGTEFQEQVRWARAALRCDPITELLESTRAPLSPKLFARNVLRSVDHTRLRIPGDPEAAYHRFCGPGTPPEVRAPS